MTAPAGARRFAPHLWLLAMIAIWGGSYAAVKIALGTLSPFAVIASRFGIALGCLLPFLHGGVRRDLRAAARPGLATGTVLATGYLLQTVGMNETSASMGGFLAGLIVLLVALGGFLFFRAPFGARSTAGLLLGLCGMALLCWPHGDPGGPRDTARGIALQIASSCAYAAHILMLSRFGRNVPAIAFCLWQLAVVAAASSAATAIDGSWAAPGVAEPWTGGVIAAVAYLGLLATALGIGVQTKVQHRIPPTHVALLFATQPLFAALCGWALLGDRLGGMQLLGGAVIVAGVVITSLDR